MSHNHAEFTDLQEPGVGDARPVTVWVREAPQGYSRKRQELAYPLVALAFGSTGGSVREIQGVRGESQEKSLGFVWLAG